MLEEEWRWDILEESVGIRLPLFEKEEALI